MNMRITKIRNRDGSKVAHLDLVAVVTELKQSFERVGFITGVELASSSAIRIGLHMRSFTIETNKLGYNAQVNDWTLKYCKSGYKRTQTPTWTQREEFNHIVNNVLDSHKLKANVKSGEYVVRSCESGRVNEWRMPEPFHNGYRLNVPSVLEIVPIKYAKDAIEWVGINAPFIGAVPDTIPKGLPRAERKLRLVKAA